MLSTSGIHYHIGEKKILNGISLDFAPGQFHVILGPNGSGKSSFLKVFSGELKPQQGRVSYDGVDVSAYDKTALAGRRAVMSQQPELHFPLSVAEVVMMGRYPHFSWRPAKKDEAICRQAMAEMEVARFADRDYLTLSGGEKQRVQFARVIVQLWDPPHSGHRYLLLDEPVSSLDIRYQHQFLQVARRLAAENFVLVAILHDLNLAIRYADNIIFMKEGRVVKKGKPAEVVTAGLVEEVFGIPVRIIGPPLLDKPLVAYGSSGDPEAAPST